MGDTEVFLLIVIALIIFIGSILGWMNDKIDKLEKEDKLGIETIGSIIALEKAMKKLNEALRTESRSLSDYKRRLRCLERRIDILESGHPDSEFDYATTDDDGNALEVWFNGKKYVPEDKRSEDTNTFYADNKVVAETTRPEEKRCCATCKHYRPGSDHTCSIRSWLQVTNARANEAASVCNNYKKVYTATKGEVDYPYIHIPYGNGEADRIMKRYDELQCEIKRLNMLAQFGGCSAQELRQRWEELMQNDS